MRGPGSRECVRRGHQGAGESAGGLRYTTGPGRLVVRRRPHSRTEVSWWTAPSVELPAPPRQGAIAPSRFPRPSGAIIAHAGAVGRAEPDGSTRSSAFTSTGCSWPRVRRRGRPPGGPGGQRTSRTSRHGRRTTASRASSESMTRWCTCSSRRRRPRSPRARSAACSAVRAPPFERPWPPRGAATAPVSASCGGRTAPRAARRRRRREPWPMPGGERCNGSGARGRARISLLSPLTRRSPRPTYSRRIFPRSSFVRTSLACLDKSSVAPTCGGGLSRAVAPSAACSTSTGCST